MNHHYVKYTLPVYSDTKSVFDEDGNRLDALLNGAHMPTEEEFEVDVCYNKPIDVLQTSSVHTETADKPFYKHKCYFKAYSGKNKAKLVIVFPGGGMKAKDAYSYMKIGSVLNSLGYAFLSITGYSPEYMALKGVTSRAAPVGSWYATEEAVKAYHYICEKYGWIDTAGVYIYGQSQGGQIAENFADFGGVPIAASFLDAPALSIQYVQMSLRMESVTAIYGITSGNFDPTKCLCCDPYTRNVSEPLTTSFSPNMTATKRRLTNSPVRIVGDPGDTYVNGNTLKVYAKAVENAGQWVEYHQYTNLAQPKHGVVQYSPVLGKVNDIDCTEGLSDMLEFFKRHGGYDYTIS